jgi:hypothetical protein
MKRQRESRQEDLRRRIKRLNISESDTYEKLQSTFSIIKQHSQALTAIGHPIPEKELVKKTRKKFPSTMAWTVFNATLARKPPKTLEKLETAVLQFVAGNVGPKNQVTPTRDVTTLLATTEPPPAPTPTAKLTCFHCGGAHRRRDCKLLSKEIADWTAGGKQGEYPGKRSQIRRPAKGADAKGADGKITLMTSISLFTHQETPRDDLWIADSGSNAHVCTNKLLFDTLEESIGHISTLGEQPVQYAGKGSVTLRATDIHKHQVDLCLNNVYYVPHGTVNILGLSNSPLELNLSRHNPTARAHGHTFRIIRVNQLPCLRATPLAAPTPPLMAFSNHLPPPSQAPVDPSPPPPNIDALWHARLGHVGAKLHSLTKRAVEGMLDPEAISAATQFDALDPCDPCHFAHHPRLPFPDDSETHHPLWAHCSIDTTGPLPPQINTKDKHLTLATDHSSKLTQGRSSKLKNLPNSTALISSWCTLNLAQTKIIRTDGAGDFMSPAFEAHCKDQGILKFEHSAPHSPQQNGRVESVFRCLYVMARAMLFHAHLPTSFLLLALQHALFLWNRTVHTGQTKTPWELAFNERPNLQRLKTFGCVAYVKVEGRLTKGEKRSWKGIYVGEDPSAKAWLVLDPSRKRVFTSRNVNFVETAKGGDHFTQLPDPQPDPQGDQVAVEGERSKETATTLTTSTTPTSSPNTISSSTSASPSGRIPTLLAKLKTLTKDRLKDWKAASIKVPRGEIKSTDPHVELWNLADDLEIAQLEEKNCWTLCEPPPGTRVIPTHMVRRVKPDPHGFIEKFKSRLVINGSRMVYGVDYTESSSPILDSTQLRTLLCIAATKRYRVSTIDIANAYIHAAIEEVIYIRIPKHGTGRLNQSLYGSKQAGHNWWKLIDEFLKSIGWEQVLNTNIYKRGDSYLGLYVDDIIHVGPEEETQLHQRQLAHKFPNLTINAKPDSVLGLNIETHEDNLKISASRIIKEILEENEMSACNSSLEPAEPGMRLPTLAKAKESPMSMEVTKAREICGKLNYITTTTRPDLAFATRQIASLTTHPIQQVQQAIKRVLRYLKGTVNIGIKFDQSLELAVWSDADFGQETDKKSITGTLVTLGKTPVAWKAKKQSLVTTSTCEAEYVAVSHAVKEAIFFRELLKALGFNQPQPTPVFCDNASAVKLSQKVTLSQRSKHIDIRYLFIKDAIAKDLVNITHVPSGEMKADIFTKPIAGKEFVNKRNKFLNMV